MLLSQERRQEDAAKEAAAQQQATREAHARREAEAEAVEKRFHEHQNVQGRALIATLDADQRAELVELARAALPSLLRSLRKRFAEIDGDYDQLTKKRGDQSIAFYFHTEALKKWGKKSQWDIQAYCEMQSVPPEVQALIKT